MAQPDQPLSSRQGFVYILANSYLKSQSGHPVLKIGATRKHPVRRARELGASTSIPGAFSLVYYRDFADCFVAETMVHHELVSHRVSLGKEFFEMRVADAIGVLDDLTRRASQQPELLSEGVVGGNAEELELQRAWKEVADTPTPWAELFASFNQSSSSLTLTGREQEQCRDLVRRLAARPDQGRSILGGA